MSEEREERVDEAGSKKVVAWKVGLVGMAVLFLAVGWMLKRSPEEVRQANQAMSAQGAGGSQLVGGNGLPGWGGEGAGETGEADSGLQGYAPFFVKGGFSFLIAFCVGLALRVFFKGTALVVGAIALALFGLQQVGWVTVDWNAMSDWWDQISGKVLAKTEGFRGFMTGNLPSAGLASLGLFTGFKKG